MSFSQGSAREFGPRAQPEDSAKGLSRRAQPKGSARVERGAVTAEWVDAMHLSATSCRQVLVALHERVCREPLGSAPYRQGIAELFL